MNEDHLFFAGVLSVLMGIIGWLILAALWWGPGGFWLSVVVLVFIFLFFV